MFWVRSTPNYQNWICPWSFYNSSVKIQLRFLQQQQIACLREKMNYQSVIILSTKSKTELTWWIEKSRFCNGRTLSQLNPQVIIQIDASRSGREAVCDWLQTSGQWSKEERTLHINVVELLAIKLALFYFTKGKSRKTIHFQINNKAAFSYLLKVCERTNIWSNERRYLTLSSKWQYVYHSKIPASSTEYSSRQRIKKKTIRLFRVASPSQSFSSGFPTMPSATSTYSLASRFLQSGDRCNDTNWNIGLPYAFPPFIMISRVL